MWKSCFVGDGTVVIWLRHSWRIHDNPLIHRAVQTAQTTGAGVCLLHIDTPVWREFYLGNTRRHDFIAYGIQEFEASLRKLYGLKLHRYKLPSLDAYDNCSEDKSWIGHLQDLFTALCASFQHSTSMEVLIERCWNPFELEEENVVAMHLATFINPAKRIAVSSINCTNLCPDFTDLLREESLRILDHPLTYNKFIRRLTGGKDRTKSLIALPIPDNMSTELVCASPSGMSKFDASGKIASCHRTGFIVESGEKAALMRLERLLDDKAYIQSFSKPNTCAMSIQPSTTVLSPYLSCGMLSARFMHHGLMDVERHVREQGLKMRAKAPRSLASQLYWREFSQFLGFVIGKPFGRMKGNVICVQEQWRTVGTGDSDFDSKYARFEAGETGYPSIDAGINQLKQQGWLHHILRHHIACFLTRGYMYAQWELGTKLFGRYLLDFDWAINCSQ